MVRKFGRGLEAANNVAEPSARVAEQQVLAERAEPTQPPEQSLERVRGRCIQQVEERIARPQRLALR